MKKLVFGYNFGKLSVAVVNGQGKADKSDWHEIDPESLNKDQFRAYQLYVEQRKLANEAKAKFEQLVRKAYGFEQATAVKASPSASSIDSVLG